MTELQAWLALGTMEALCLVYVVLLFLLDTGKAPQADIDGHEPQQLGE